MAGTDAMDARKSSSMAGKSKMKMKVGATPTVPSKSLSSKEAHKETIEESDSSYGASDENEDDDNDYMDEEDDDVDIPSQTGRSKKTMKRKRRAVSPGAFGETLEQLLGVGPAEDDKGAQPGRDGILSMAPSIRRTANATTLRAKAARLALEQRREREERAHIKDVIGDWGAPGVHAASMKNATSSAAIDAWLENGGTKGYERRLRKTAQRGVVKLFNAIRAAQTTTEEDIDKARSLQTTKQARKVNALGNKDMAVKQLSKTHFLELLRQTPKASASAAPGQGP